VRELNLAAYNPMAQLATSSLSLSSLTLRNAVLRFEYPQKAIDTQVAIA